MALSKRWTVSLPGAGMLKENRLSLPLASPTKSVPSPLRLAYRGYAQIYGKYNTSAYDKLRLDMMYIENYSPLLDIRLIILTLRIIFSKDSTEGIDVAMENQRRADALWHELDEQNEEKEKGSAE